VTDNLLGMPRTQLPADPAADVVAGLQQGPGHGSPADSGSVGDGMPLAALESVAAAYPASSLLQALLAEAARRGHRRTVLHAQVAAEGFYARYGFERTGDVFMEAGIAHTTMARALVQPG